ncbi:glycoside hydrolase family 15 protein [Rhodococcus sp. CSLK01-03]|uniref:Glycoside hydrolase family 15 protein n=1 Tax=Rhodococcus indonesiensis TaxID=3055869 RepID=A0ABT7RNQ3_9NOCA|nr:glycoside hydrolase family 15 protein [Rhodococcus indonesiensis]MDM7489253.1 glycoside hydrolase family 15 protein [Rhodococcus indonesiensis]
MVPIPRYDADVAADADVAPHVLREYSFVADGERGALIGPRGDFAWMCAPLWHSEPVFSTLLGGTGTYVVAPDTSRFVWGGYYEDGTLIWRSRWVDNGIVECREALAMPADPHTVVILRRLVAVEGDARLRVALRVRVGYEGRGMECPTLRDGVWHARAGSLHLRWQGAGTATSSATGFEMRLGLRSGRTHDLLLEISDRPFATATPSAEAVWRRTEQAWAAATAPIHGTLADRDARHATAVLTGLTSGSGGMVAAATTALPERAAQGRNYDYRYCWIRDQCYAGHATAVYGPHPLLDAAINFVSDRLLADGPQLKPAYTVGGGPVPSQSTPPLPGYPGGKVVVGNWVNQQFQLDTFGEALLLFAAASRRDRLEQQHWRAVEAAVAAIESRWTEPDAGIWELHTRRWTHSTLTCAAGLRAVAAVAPRIQRDHWSSLADTLTRSAVTECVHPSGRWQRAPDDERVDAALLLPTLRGALPPDHPTSRHTLDAVRTELGRDGYVYRFRHDDRPLAEAEGAFLLCGFVMALADHQQGNSFEAVRWFERNRAACGSPALFTEEFDVIERQLRGNLPQAFVHALLLESAQRLARPWRSRG